MLSRAQLALSWGLCAAALSCLVSACDHEPNDINRDPRSTQSNESSSQQATPLLAPSEVATRTPAPLSDRQLSAEGVTAATGRQDGCAVSGLLDRSSHAWRYPTGSMLVQTIGVAPQPVTVHCGRPVELTPRPAVDQFDAWCGRDCGVVVRQADRVTAVTVHGASRTNAMAALRRLTPALAASVS